jgi:hypothetical protein
MRTGNFPATGSIVPAPGILSCRDFLLLDLHEDPGIQHLSRILAEGYQPKSPSDSSPASCPVAYCTSEIGDFSLKPPMGILVHQSPLKARLYLFSLNPRISEVIIRKNTGTGPE